MYAPMTNSPRLPANLHASLMNVATCGHIDAGSPGSRIAELFKAYPVTHRRLHQGEHLFRAGDHFSCLYILNAGFAKTCHVSEDGCEQTTGFHLRGDVLGLDAIGSGSYGCDAIALDICDLIVVPFEAVIAQGMQSPQLVRELYSAFSAEIRSDREQMLSIGSLPAEGRVANFLLDMSRRFGSRGFSSTELQLRLTRQEIGSLLGLKLETVSRALSHFAKLGLIEVCLREITLVDVEGLHELVAGHDARAECLAAA